MKQHGLLSCLPCLVLLVTAANSEAQQTVVAPSRSIDWSTTGVTGGIPTRTTVCATLNPGATRAQINSAIAACPSGQVVSLSAGTYSLNGQVTLKSGVTLRGAGADQTRLNFTLGGSCGGVVGLVCFPGPNANGESCCTQNQANWTAGYAKGTTQITLSANTVGSTKPSVGTILFLDQIVDGTTTAADRFPDVYVCSTLGVCVQAGFTPTGRGTGAAARMQAQVATVTGISAGACPCTVSVSPPIAMPNWRGSQSPQAFWVTNPPTNGAGLEDLWIDYQTSGSVANIAAAWTRDSWIKGVKSTSNFNNSTSSSLKNMVMWYSTNMTIKDSYLFNGREPDLQDAYGISCFASGNARIENNIIQFMRAPILFEMCPLAVVGYNYAIRMVTSGNWNYAGVFDNHASAGDFILVEGNQDTIINLENYHGNAQFATLFRNHMVGRDASLGTNQTAPIMNYGYSRFTNIIGNVLGNSSYHTNYQFIVGDGQSSSFCQRSIFNLGSSGNCAHGSFDDPHAVATIYRWGNWDTVSNAARFVSSEVPSALALYAQPVPPTQVLPASLYLPAKPAFFGSIPWPAIGPDVTGGEVPGAGGHVYRIPARKCFDDVMGAAFADTVAAAFNASSCYVTAVPPTVPSNFTVTK